MEETKKWRGQRAGEETFLGEINRESGQIDE